MGRKLWLAIAASCLLLAWPGRARAEYFAITTFHSDILVAPDSSFTVREIIEVEFASQRHGIYRDLPIRYTEDTGGKLRTPLSVLSVTDERERPWKYSLARQGDALRIRIGHPDRFVEGRQVYVITYRVKNAILFLGDRDELYWNVTGNGWEVPMGRVSVNAMLEGSGRLELKARCYTGTYGSREEACDFTATERGGIFRASRSLNPYEGFTIALGWEKGVVSEPSTIRKLLWAMDMGQTWVLLIPLVCLALMYRHWRLKGKDPEVGDTVTVVYAPPEDQGRELTAAEVGSLSDGAFDRRDLIGSIVGLAVKGHLTITEEKEERLIFDTTDYRLTRTGKVASGLTPFEQRLLEDIFGSSGSILVSSLRDSFYTHLPGLRKKAMEALKGLGYYLSDPLHVMGLYVGAGFGVALAVMLPGLVAARWLGMSRGWFVLAGALSALPVFAFAPVMPARTRKGALAWLRVRGFEEFLSRAEKDRLERMADKNLFEKYLPYAIALGVSGRWARAFEGIYQEPPRWYSSGSLTGFQPAVFNHSLGSAISKMGSTMYSSPRSSGGGGGGSSGGGSSGGGFGGGGGGSW